MNGFSFLPPVVKNLLLLNVFAFIMTFLIQAFYHYDISDTLGLHYFLSQNFRPIQLVSYMFLHGDFWHILFNMFAYMFGSALENFWGPKRFFIYYMATGIGAGIFQILVSYIRLQMIGANIPSDILEKIYTEGFQIIQNNQNYSDPTLAQINAIVNSTTIGASGAVFGLLMAFGMMFPNTMLYVYFAIPIKAKWFVLIYGLIELYSGIRNSANDNVAHFAHLGGMIFGFILIYYWRRKGTYSR